MLEFSEELRTSQIKQQDSESYNLYLFLFSSVEPIVNGTATIIEDYLTIHACSNHNLALTYQPNPSHKPCSHYHSAALQNDHICRCQIIMGMDLEKHAVI